MEKKEGHNKLVVEHLKKARLYPNMARQGVGYELLLHQHLRLQPQTIQPCDHLQSGRLARCFTQKN
ncbi:hypothetical protein HMPREF1869_01280 [Bacteroidales bacterium KA00251]|nr:hypothetical protein HMPREF1869_01280 [Bacteroidales bacterium KA00251]